MKNLDLISKRIAVVAMSICAILLCGSLLFLSISAVGKASASPVKQIKDLEPTYMLFPMGMSDGNVYYIFDGGNAWTFEKIELSKAVPASWVK